MIEIRPKATYDLYWLLCRIGNSMFPVCMLYAFVCVCVCVAQAANFHFLNEYKLFKRFMVFSIKRVHLHLLSFYRVPPGEKFVSRHWEFLDAIYVHRFIFSISIHFWWGWWWRSYRLLKFMNSLQKRINQQAALFDEFFCFFIIKNACRLHWSCNLIYVWWKSDERISDGFRSTIKTS